MKNFCPFSSLSLLTFLLVAQFSCAQIEFLQSGPMLGYCEMREVMIWVQTTEPAEVKAVYWDSEEPDKKFETNAYQTNKREVYTARLIADEVLPGKNYDYQLYINNKPVKLDNPTSFSAQTDWAYKIDPPAFSVAMGSCAYINDPPYDRPGKPYGSNYQIFQSISNKNPDVMLWLGDNMYLRPADFYSRTGIMHRYTHTRSLPEMQSLLANAHHYAVWDDHDFGPNDSDRSYTHKEVTLEAFKLFWGNPTYGVNHKGGTTSFFKWNDIDFFLLDNRYFRSPDRRETGESTMLGEDQLEWLIDALTYSRAPFKMVVLGSQVLNTAPVFENYANRNKEERARLLKAIEEEDLKGVIFLTGDRHKSELSAYENGAGNMVYDLTVSPLTSGWYNSEDEPNEMRVEGTHVAQHNFGIIEFTGPFRERVLTMKLFDADGKELWKHVIEEQVIYGTKEKTEKKD
ncbi:MAG: alkaline phosphatase D family protein [Bacteroidota bacterium]